MIICFRINGTDYEPTQCTIPEGNYSTTTLAAALCRARNENYPINAPTGTPTRYVPSAKLSNHIITISDPTDTFEI